MFLSTEKQPRDAYRELLLLSKTFLGGKGTYFYKPGPIHKARWLSKAIYVLKMYLFSKQLKLLRKESENLSKMASFIVFFYGRELCHDLQVTNDAAERAVAMCTDYWGKMTRSHDQWQNMLLSVYENKKKFPIVS
ncbi:hypothetical protein TKK_0012935 [Trichogramma kaykai]